MYKLQAVEISNVCNSKWNQGTACTGMMTANLGFDFQKALMTANLDCNSQKPLEAMARRRKRKRKQAGWKGVARVRRRKEVFCT